MAAEVEPSMQKVDYSEGSQQDKHTIVSAIDAL